MISQDTEKMKTQAPHAGSVSERSKPLRNTDFPKAVNIPNYSLLKTLSSEQLSLMKLSNPNLDEEGSLWGGFGKKNNQSSNEEPQPESDKLNPLQRFKSENKANDLISKRPNYALRTPSLSPAKSRGEIQSQDSGTGESEEDVHDVWDDTELELRGIDTNRNLQSDGRRFDFFHWYKARYGSFPNKRTQITNRRVAEAILRLSCGHRNSKDLKLTKPDFSDTTDYSKPYPLNRCSNALKFMEFWRFNKRIKTNYLPTYSKKVFQKEVEPSLNQLGASITKTIRNPQFRTSQPASELKPFLIPLEESQPKQGFKGRLQKGKQDRAVSKAQFIEVVKRNEKSQGQGIHKHQPSPVAKVMDRPPLTTESTNIQIIRGDLNHIRKASMSSANLDNYRLPKDPIRKRKSHIVSGSQITDWMGAKIKSPQKWTLESILVENKPKLFRA